jgi:hypothetical protein
MIRPDAYCVRINDPLFPWEILFRPGMYPYGDALNSNQSVLNFGAALLQDRYDKWPGLFKCMEKLRCRCYNVR